MKNRGFFPSRWSGFLTKTDPSLLIPSITGMGQAASNAQMRKSGVGRRG